MTVHVNEGYYFSLLYFTGLLSFVLSPDTSIH